MSESDSDVDFESADEDTENIAISKEYEKTAIPTESANDTISKESAKNAIGEIETNNCDEHKDLKVEDDTCERVSSHLNISIDQPNPIVKTEGHLETKPPSCEIGVNSDINTKNNSSSECKDVKKFSKTESQSSEGEKSISSPETESKRVTLRLEKKLQQKNQQIASPDCERIVDSQVQEKPSSWGFSSWGTSLLSSAASSVSTFTSQVSQGIGTVIETVETSLGAPPPEDLALALSKRKESQDSASEKSEEKNSSYQKSEDSIGSDNKTDPSPVLGTSLFTGVTSFTRAIESTGTKVLMGGLDTLELIGKKTIDILTEGDPGLRKKRSAFSEGTTLSQMLREARIKAKEAKACESEDDQEEAIHYSKFFDDFQGLIHLEALEMLSGQSQAKVQGILIMLSGDTEVKEKLDKVKNICEDLPSADDTPDDEAEHDFEQAFSEHVQALQLQINVEKIKQVRNLTSDWLSECQAEQNKGEIKDSKDLYRRAISSLAEFTAKSVEQFHKVAELILVQSNLEPDAIICATHLTGLTSVLSVEVGIIASKFCHCLSTAADDSEDPDSVTPLITSVYLEASNSTTYIQDAFQLLIPVLQAAFIE